VPTEVIFPPKLQCLFEPHRYKVLHGGRGGAKSWGAARALLVQGLERPLRILCAREFQNSIKDSVHKLLSDQIATIGLTEYDIQRDSIRGANGTEFSFEGIRHNIGKIRSYEGVDICWVEEANMVSKTSWEVLVPTIRKPNSEIWITFNPELETDETYQRFVVHPPDSAKVVKIGWQDNPWFPEVLRQEMEHLKKTDYDAYLNVWEGFCRQILEGAVYAKELREAQQLSRIMHVPYDHTKGVHTVWDLGRSDKTTIWFVQIIGFEFHIIDYYENRLEHLDHYLGVLQKKGYIYDTMWLPHDAKAKTLGTKRSIEEQAREKGHKVRIVPRLSVADGINAARTLFPMVYFDEKRCADGLQALRHYRYEEVRDASGHTSFGREPLHDWASHAADAFRYLAIAVKEPKKPGAERLIDAVKKKFLDLESFGGAPPGQTGWMR
jgi:phage terminase large subunit